MENLPPEMLFEIAKALAVEDLRRFRLTCRRCALATFPVLARRLYVLNTVPCLVEFKSFLSTIPRACTKELVIYQGKWPVISRQAWELSPLLLPEGYPRPPSKVGEGRLNQPTEAFLRYQDFMENERSRKSAWDMEILAEVLRRLPNLSSISVEHLQPWGQMSVTNPQLARLRKEIWVSPIFNGNTDHLVQCLSQVASSHQKLRKLAVHGRLHSSTLQNCEGFKSIAELTLGSLVVHSEEKWNFLSSFPYLRQLDINVATNSSAAGFQHRGTFAFLTTARLRRVCISEEHLLLLVTKSPVLEKCW